MKFNGIAKFSKYMEITCVCDKQLVMISYAYKRKFQSEESGFLVGNMDTGSQLVLEFSMLH
jgi:hypothetical protein